MSLLYYSVFSALLFGLSLAGLLINRKNILLILMCLELMLLAINTQFLAFARLHQDLSAQVFVFFILSVAAAEAAIGLAIVVVLFKRHGSIHVTVLDELKG